MFLAALDQTIVSPAIPTIGAELGGASTITWILSAYFLTSTAVTPLYGKFADIYGRRPVLLTGIGIFVAGSIIAALAQSMTMLIVARAIQGIGGGGLVALAQTVIGDLVPPMERGKFSAYISATWAAASLAGPILGGVLSEQVHWSLIFWINLPLAAIAVFMTERSLAKIPWQKRDHSIDIPGAVLVVAATTCLLLALTFGAGDGWLATRVLLLFAAALVLAVLFAARLATAKEPLIPLDVLGNQVVFTGTASVFFAMAAFVGLSVYVPLYLEQVAGLSTSAAGFALVGYLVGTVAGATTAGRLMPRIRHYKTVPIFGLAAAAVALGLIAWRVGHMSLVEFEVLLIIAGIGGGTQFPVTTVAIQNAVDLKNLGVATGALAFLRSLGAAIGVAVVGTVAAVSGITVGLADASAGPVDGEAFAPVFFAAMVSALGGLLFILLMEERPLRGREQPRPLAASE